MGTTFGVKIPSLEEVKEIAFRSSGGISFTNPLGELLPDELEVIPLDNDAQGVFTIRDIKNKIKEQNNE